MDAVSNRWRVLLPVTASVGLGLGALIYAGQNGVNCDGTRATPVMAHPPFPWPWYAGFAAVMLGASLAPLLTARRKRDQS